MILKAAVMEKEGPPEGGNPLDLTTQVHAKAHAKTCLQCENVRPHLFFPMALPGNRHLAMDNDFWRPKDLPSLGVCKRAKLNMQS